MGWGRKNEKDGGGGAFDKSKDIIELGLIEHLFDVRSYMRSYMRC